MKKTRKPKKQGAVVVIPWMIARLRNQATLFFARKDEELRRTLRIALKPARSYTDVEITMRDSGAVRTGNGDGPTWHDFMDRFMNASTKKHVA